LTISFSNLRIRQTEKGTRLKENMKNSKIIPGFFQQALIL